MDHESSGNVLMLRQAGSSHLWPRDIPGPEVDPHMAGKERRGRTGTHTHRRAHTGTHTRGYTQEHTQGHTWGHTYRVVHT